jgi:hypothetical protein
LPSQQFCLGSYISTQLRRPDDEASRGLICKSHATSAASTTAAFSIDCWRIGQQVDLSGLYCAARRPSTDDRGRNKRRSSASTTKMGLVVKRGSLHEVDSQVDSSRACAFASLASASPSITMPSPMDRLDSHRPADLLHEQGLNALKPIPDPYRTINPFPSEVVPPP